MNIDKKQLTEESKYLDTVKQIARKKERDIDIKIDKEKQNIFEFKKFIWNECGSLSELEYGNVLNEADERVSRTNDKTKQMLKYQKICKNAYFGRIDFKTDDELYNVYIGTYGLIDEDKNYIFDWRAPISSLFYDNLIGPAEYEAPIGKIKGDVSLRRQYKIENGKITRIIENDINIDDEFLQDVLSSNSSEKMKNIVTTIQKEQNEVIRNTKDKYLIVQGVAGSGKTSVALHRIAYLLYKEKDLNHNNILIFSPNDLFSEYISNVLPELGEDNVLNTTFDDLIRKFLNGKKIESFSKFLGRKYENINNNEENISNQKDKLDEFIEYFTKQAIFKKDIVFNKVFFSKFELNNLLLKKYEKLPYFERLINLTEYICNNIKVSYKRNKNKIYNRLIRELGISQDPVDIYNMFLEYAKDDRIIKDEINYDDLEKIIYILFELNDYPYNTNVKHIVIDEAQDYSKIQFLILKRIFPYAYFTILGDLNQTINPTHFYKSLEEISEVFAKNVKYIELKKTYRSSGEIINYTNSILKINNVNAVRGNNGYDVLLKDEKNLNDIIEDIKIFKKNKMKTIAIITKNMKETNKIYNKLVKDEDMKIIKNDIKKDYISILPSYASKGLEFDAVIAYNDINNVYTENEKNLYYVVCTRAQHMLIIYNNKKPIDF